MNIDFIGEKTESNKGSKVQEDTQLKEMLINYVGSKNKSIVNDEVTVENIVETLAEEFPEFLLVVAEENWIRGYHQALSDIEVGENMVNEDKKTKNR